MILISSQQRVLTPSYPFGRKFGRQGLCSFSDKTKNFHRGSLSMSSKSTCFQLQYDLLSSPQRVPRPSYPFLGNLGRSGKESFAEKLKSLIEVPNVFHVKVHVLNFNMILISSSQRVLTPSYPFFMEPLLKFLALSPKYSQNWITRCQKHVLSLDILREPLLKLLAFSENDTLHYHPNFLRIPSLISIACSQTELSTSEKLWEIR